MFKGTFCLFKGHKFLQIKISVNQKLESREIEDSMNNFQIFDQKH